MLSILARRVGIVGILAAPIARGAAQGIPAAQSADAASPNVPVTRVMLFSSGVGYFEHSGIVHGNGTTELRFKTSEINDILKSIVLQDLDGGRVGTVTYPSHDPLGKTLKSFQVDITQNPGLADLLNQLRGARVTLQVQSERLTGTILGVESRRTTVVKGEAVPIPVLNLLTGAMIRSVELQSITTLRLDDPQLQDELTKALATVAQAHDQDRKPVVIAFNGAGDRRVRIGYVVETPVWKTSYRLVLGPPNSKSAYVQGWAIVENQTESDWNNVSLSLVSGRPISFTMDLYQPLYATRPNVVPESFAGLRPQVYAGGVAKLADSVGAAPAGGRVGEAAAARQAPRRIGYGPDGRPSPIQLQEVVVTGAADNAAEPRPREINVGESVRSMASTGALGELFRYTVGNVTLPRQRSAMLPIITDSIAAERVSIYNASVLRTNPLNGVWLRNTTGKHLLQGPVTVLEKGGYAGDAQIDNLPPGQDRLLSYGIDLDMTVDNIAVAPASTIMTAKIVKGMLVVSSRLVSMERYSANNNSGTDKVLVIEHPRRVGWQLVDTPAPFETAPTVERFRETVPPGKATTFVVQEELVQNQSILMLPSDVGQLLRFSRAGEVPKDVRDAIGKAIEMKQAVLDVEREMNARSQQINEITAEQARIRENMKTVSPSTTYYDRLLAKLNDQESSIERLQAERAGLVTKRDGLRKDLESYLEGLSIG